MTAPAELDRIERQLAAALERAREMGWHDRTPEPEPVHDSPVYRELERLSFASSHPQGRCDRLNATDHEEP